MYSTLQHERETEIAVGSNVITASANSATSKGEFATSAPFSDNALKVALFLNKDNKTHHHLPNLMRGNKTALLLDKQSSSYWNYTESWLLLNILCILLKLLLCTINHAPCPTRYTPCQTQLLVLPDSLESNDDDLNKSEPWTYGHKLLNIQAYT